MTIQYYLDAQGHTIVDKGPLDVVDYSFFDFTGYLTPSQDTIIAYDVECVGVSLVSDKPPTFAGGLGTLWVQGGIFGTENCITVYIKTAGGREFSIILYFNILPMVGAIPSNFITIPGTIQEGNVTFDGNDVTFDGSPVTL